MCRLRRVFVLSLVVLLSVGVLTPSPVGASNHTGPLAAQLGDSGIEPDGVLLRAELREDGDATFTVEYRIRLDDENTTAAFESLQGDIEDNESAYSSTFADRMRATARAAENTTGREMTVRDVSVQTSRRQLPQEYGVVTYEFEWGGFAATTADGLEAGDALAGLFLDRQTTLVIGWPEGFSPVNVEPSPDERRDDAVVWVGPTDFRSGQPAVTVSESFGGGDTGDGATPDGATGDDSGNSLLLVLGGIAVAAVVIGVVLWRRSGDSTSDAPVAESRGGGGSASQERGTTDATTQEGETATPADAESAPVDVPTDAEDEERDEATAPAEGDEPPVDDDAEAPWEDELLSNEEKVLLLLEHNDGRMKQQAIASELSWSDAKTSQVIGKLRDGEDVETFRIGRENVVSLPGSGLS